jgi:hypothetical protein
MPYHAVVRVAAIKVVRGACAIYAEAERHARVTVQPRFDLVSEQGAVRREREHELFRPSLAVNVLNQRNDYVPNEKRLSANEVKIDRLMGPLLMHVAGGDFFRSSDRHSARGPLSANLIAIRAAQIAPVRKVQLDRSSFEPLCHKKD